jgi:DNA repair exonuclease SbcCD ATPase subunit
MSTLTDKLPKLPTDKLPKLPTVKLPEVDLDEAKKPAFAAVGVVDLYLEQVKELPADAKKVQAKLEAARTARTAQLKTVPAQLKTLPTQVKELRTEVETRVAKAQTKATAYYSKLALRGERLVTQIRRQPATEAAIAEGKEAVKKAEAATVAAKKSAKAAEKAVEGAAAKIG